MKLEAKIEIIIVFIAVGIIFTFIPIFNNYDKGSEFGSINNLSLSKVSGKIYINNNWTDVKATEICTGLGTSSDPYVIEDLTIDGGGSGSCILIQYSTVYFRIENCTIYNFGDAGIKLYHVDNGQLIDNLVSGNTVNNNEDGISLYLSNNNTVSGNTVNNNDEGIVLSNSDINTISENTINNNQIGINLWYSDQNPISGNTVKNNTYKGINLDRSVDNTISENTANYNSYYGINLDSSANTIISGNTVYNNNDGIRLYRSDNSKILGNFINNNTYRGIHLWDSDSITVSGNYMFKCGLEISGGFEILRSHYIDTTNLVNAKPLYYYVDRTNLSLYHVWNAGQVILVHCTDSLISNLNISDSSIGISLHYCNNNLISGNTANHNNLYGIYLDSSSNNRISGNTANNNSYYGIYLQNSNNSIVSDNLLIGNDECIVEEKCVGNIFGHNGSCTYGEQPRPEYPLIFLLGILSVVYIIIIIIIIKKLRKS